MLSRRRDAIPRVSTYLLTVSVHNTEVHATRVDEQAPALRTLQRHIQPQETQLVNDQSDSEMDNKYQFRTVRPKTSPVPKRTNFEIYKNEENVTQTIPPEISPVGGFVFGG